MDRQEDNRAVSGERDGPDQARLRYMLDNVVTFVGALTPCGILTQANEPALRAAGVARKDVIGKPFWDCYWWNYDPAVQSRLREAISRAASGETVRYEAEARIADDQRMIMDFQLVPRVGEDGKINELISSGVDITQHKVNALAAQAASDTFKRLVKNSPFGIYAVDADFRLYLVGQGAKKVFENVDPLLGRDFADVLRTIWPEPFATEAINLFRHTLETGDPYHAPSTVERRHDTDEIESYDWKIERVMLPDGRHGVVCHFYDLSEREHHESALRASEARFRATFENAAVGIAHVAPAGGLLRVNQKLCKITGYAQEELRQLKFQDITHPGDLSSDLDQIDRVLRGKADEYEMEKRYLRKDGSIVAAKLTMGCVRDELDAVDYFIAVVEDISAKKASQDHQLLLVSELNHRVKNTLATIQAMASHTLRNAKSPEDFREAFSGRLRAIAAAHDTIFQHGSGRADLRSLIMSQLAAYGAEGQERLAIKGPDTTLTADRAHGLGLIVHELATNAAKYGALSNDTGKILINWTRETNDRLEMTWSEIGGPPVVPPVHKGFGSRLIETTLEHAMGGNTKLDYHPDGLRIALSFATGESE